MPIVPFLAMTAAEMGKVSEIPQKVAWLACHFSPYGLGLSNLPRTLPPKSILVLDDITPVRKHDPQIITIQILETIEKLDCYGVLLDFQNPGNPEAAALTKQLSDVLPCPVIVSEPYAGNLTCPVFLSPVPPSTPLKEHISSWPDRELWLEIGLTGEQLIVSEQGCKITPILCPDTAVNGFEDQSLNCHYVIETNEKSAGFTLWRTMDDLTMLMEEARCLGITNFIGLYQELS